MSVRVVIEQTANGWKVEATNGDDVVVETSGSGIFVAVHPDDDDTATPLDVTLGSPPA